MAIGQCRRFSTPYGSVPQIEATRRRPFLPLNNKRCFARSGGANQPGRPDSWPGTGSYDADPFQHLASRRDCFGHADFPDNQRLERRHLASAGAFELGGDDRADQSRPFIDASNVARVL